MLFSYLFINRKQQFRDKKVQRIVISKKRPSLFKFKEYYKKMKTFRLTAASFIFAAIFAVSAFAQAQPSNFKIVVIDTGAFDSKDGITKYVNAMNTLETEFKPIQAEIQTLATKYQNLAKEIEILRVQAETGKVPIEPKMAQAKVEEYQNLELTIKRKQEDAKRRIEAREPQIMGPVRQDIGKALNEFAKKNGYTMILDANKLDSAGLILAFDETKADATKEFIAFYNTRPAGAATATATKP